jgi:hypothetical protein
VVLCCNSVRDEPALRRQLHVGRVSGICRASPTSSWGTELGPRLRGANPRCSLTSAWVVEELREPPSAARVAAIRNGSVACFAFVLAAVVILLWRR